MNRLEAFFSEIDTAWVPPPDRVRLPIIGSVALMLQTSYHRGTNDGDVLETADLDTGVQSRLLELAGRDTNLHQRNGLYLDIVGNGIPFLPQQPIWHRATTLDSLVHIEVVLLDVTDVVVSKLKRFIARDVDDIRAMVDRDAVPHARLVDRFRAAADAWAMDARADDLPKFMKRLHQVERDLFGFPATPVELPSWIGSG